jgi:hypothetical protein
VVRGVFIFALNPLTGGGLWVVRVFFGDLVILPFDELDQRPEGRMRQFDTPGCLQSCKPAKKGVGREVTPTPQVLADFPARDEHRPDRLDDPQAPDRPLPVLPRGGKEEVLEEEAVLGVPKVGGVFDSPDDENKVLFQG